MSVFPEYGLWPLVLLAALGGLSIVGLLVTVGARMRLPDRPPWRGEYAIAGTAAASWTVVMLVFFSLAPWWGRLVVGALMAVWASATCRAQIAGLVSGAYARRLASEFGPAEQEDRS